MSSSVALVEVRHLGLPVEEHQRAAAHVDELLREFSYLSGASSELPGRLLQLRDDLQERFAAFTAGPRTELDEAVARGQATVDLTHRIPAEAGAVAQQAMDMLDAADEYCRRGEYLLTLAAPPAAVRYRRWYFGEFVRQCAGEEPVPWPEHAP